MRICHISDTHSYLNRLQGSFDVICHSGDFLPDPPGNPSFKDEIGLWQLDWMKDNMESIKKWIGDYPFLFTLGNHDHADPYEVEKLLIKNGINASCLHDDIIKVNNIGFYDKSPIDENAFGLYDYLIKGTEKAFSEVVKMIK